jgi:hypothetical protein
MYLGENGERVIHPSLCFMLKIVCSHLCSAYLMPNSPVAPTLTPSYTNAKTLEAGVSQGSGGGKAQKTLNLASR